MPGSGVKLDFTSAAACQLYGRDHEMQKLETAFEKSQQVNDGKVMVVLEGESGVGKTALIEAFRDRVAGRCFFCKGKFDKEGAADRPLMALIGNVTQLVDALEQEDAVLWRGRILESVKAESQFIARLVPRLRAFLGEDWDDQIITQDVTGGHAFERLKMALSTFLMFVSSHRPVVFVIEDLQWADKVSLSLMGNKQNAGCGKIKGYLFVMAYRPLGPEVAAAMENAKEMAAHLESITLTNLSVDHVNGMLQGLLRRDKADVQDLAEVVHRKTGGNAFFVVQFVREMERRRLVYFETNTVRWEWDTQRIMHETDISDNVVDVVAGRIKTLSPDMQLVLTVAASLGPSRFTVDTVYHAAKAAHELESVDAIDRHYDKEERKEESKEESKIGCTLDVEQLLVQAESHGFVEKACKTGRSDSFKFAHDKLQEGAYSLIPPGDMKTRMHYLMGKELWKQMNALPDDQRGTAVEDRLALLCAHQFNLGADLIQSDECRLVMAQLNLKAANIAQQQVALPSAIEYLRAALKYLPSAWENHYDMMLEISTKLMKMYMGCGLVDECEDRISDIMENATSCMQKLEAYHASIYCNSFRGNHDEAYKIGLCALSKLGVQLPRRFKKVQMLRTMQKAKRMLRNKTDEELLALSDGGDKTGIDASDFLVALLQVTTVACRTDDRALIIVYTLLATLERISGKVAGIALVTFGQSLGLAGDCEGAARYGRIANRIAEKGQGGYRDGLTLCLSHCLIHHWTHPYHESIEPVLRAYQIFASSTEADSWHMNLAMGFYSELYLCCGLCLRPLETDLREFSRTMQQLGEPPSTGLFRPWWQLVLNLMGRAEDPMILNGEAVDYEPFVAKLRAEKQVRLLDLVVICRMLLAYILDDWDLAYKLSSDMQPIESSGPSPMAAQKFFTKGMIASSRAKSTGKRQYAKTAKQILRCFEKSVNKGTINCYHMMLLLQAEQCENIDDAQAAYDKAISAAARRGFLHHHALANERAGAFFIDHGDAGWAATYLTRARDIYSDWGAQAKVEQLERKYAGCFEQQGANSSRDSGSGLKARPRFEEMSLRNKSNRMSILNLSPAIRSQSGRLDGDE